MHVLFAAVPSHDPFMVGIGLVAIALAVIAIYYQLEVRLVLLVTAFFLGCLAGVPQAIIQRFWATFTDEKFVVPICSAMGFAYVLKDTGCDRHLVHLLVNPLKKIRMLLIPGTVLVGFLVNMPIVSQTSTAVSIGTVIIPILLAARISPVTVGAAVLLGSSVGGELLNPGAPELRTTIEESMKAAPAFGFDPAIFDKDRCVRRILPLNLMTLFVATGVFWLLSWRHEKAIEAQDEAMATTPVTDNFRVNLLKAAVPIVPLLILYLTAPPFNLFEVPFDWLESVPRSQAPPGRFESRLIGTAMLIGVILAAAVSWKRSLNSVSAFFEGAGYGFTHIISLIVIAQCFGEGIKRIGLDVVVGQLIDQAPGMLIPMAGTLPLGFAALCGSGMAATQSLFGFFVEPAFRLDVDPTHVGSVVSIAAAAGRTMSPVAAVTLMSASMTGTNPLVLARRVALPLLCGVAAMVVLAMILSPRP